MKCEISCKRSNTFREYSHESLDVIAIVAQFVPLIDPVIIDVTHFVILVRFNQTEGEHSAVEYLDIAADVLVIRVLAPVDSDGAGRRRARSRHRSTW
jgi:uncharacterized radical SAM superfamily protein